MTRSVQDLLLLTATLLSPGAPWPPTCPTYPEKAPVGCTFCALLAVTCCFCLKLASTWPYSDPPEPVSGQEYSLPSSPLQFIGQDKSLTHFTHISFRARTCIQRSHEATSEGEDVKVGGHLKLLLLCSCLPLLLTPSGSPQGI